LLTTIKNINILPSFPIGGIIGIVIGSLLVVVIISLVICRLVRGTQMNNALSEPSSIPIKKKSISGTIQQYLITTRTNTQTVRKSKGYATQSTLSSQVSSHKNLVSVEC
jgi:hypothetical protein